ncbi:MAG: DMT family transporter [Gammaproteobacteria bacterium]|nr:DMT family transporter [Gammaproteobacteria bacterium]
MPIAFIGIIVIWSTTPLGIKWSAEGAGFLFAITARMVIGAAIFLVIMHIWRQRVLFHRQALIASTVSGLGTYFGMLVVYWAALFIPSGLMAVLFGLLPFFTGVMATIWLGEKALTWPKLLGSLLGVLGLLIIFGGQTKLEEGAVYGIAGTLLALCISAATIVFTKKFGAGVPTFSVTAGGVLLSTPLFVATLLVLDPTWPVDVPLRATLSIIYLGVAGSVIGFLLFFFVVKRLDASRVALITLVTPVTGLLVGCIFNNEILPPMIWYGSIVILLGLSFHYYGEIMPPQPIEQEG